MALNLLNTYVNTTNANVDNIELVLDKTRKGFCAASLTEWNTTTVPAIAGGSVVEIDGGMFEADGDETLGGAPSNGLCYIKLIPEPVAGLTATAELTNDAPVWNVEKQGWYSSAPGEGNCRYLGSSKDRYYFMTMAAGPLYSDKGEVLTTQSGKSLILYNDGDIDALGNIGINAINNLSAVQELTGTTSAGGNLTSIAYPGGFTATNCHILSCKVYDGTYWRFGIAYNASDMDIHIYLSPTNINIYVGNSLKNKSYRILITKTL